MLATVASTAAGKAAGAMRMAAATAAALGARVLVPGPLDDVARAGLRTAARAIWASRAGHTAASRGLQVHHRIPLEYAHLTPRADPNRAANLVGVNPSVHGDIAATWNAWARSLSGRAPSAAEVKGFASAVEQMFGPEMTFLLR